MQEIGSVFTQRDKILYTGVRALRGRKDGNLQALLGRSGLGDLPLLRGIRRWISIFMIQSFTPQK